MDDEDEIDLMSILRTLWRGKWVIALCATIGLAIGWYEAFRVAVPQYSATAQMALQIRNEQVVNLQSVISGVSGDEYSMNTEMEIIRSRELISQLVDELDLVNDPEFNPTLAEPGPVSITALPRIALNRLRSLIAPAPVTAETGEPDEDALYQGVVSRVRGAISPEIGTWSYIFTISARSQDPVKAALLANTLARIYRDDQIRIKVEATDNAAQWLSARVSELALELEERQQAAALLRSQNALVSTEGLQAVNAQAIELRQRLQIAQGQAERAAARAAAIAAAPEGDVLARQSAAQDAQLDAIATAVLAGDAGAQLRFDRRYAQVALQADAEAERAAAQVAETQAALDALSAQFEDQSTDLLALQQLERETEATRILYETFLTRLRETTVQQGVHQADSRILSEATPGRMVAPRRMVMLATALMVGLVFGVGIVMLREFMQNTFRTADELERRTGLVVLGQIPRIPARKRPGTIAYLREKPTSAAAEAIRNLRTSVLLSDVDKPPRVIMSTSSIPGEGKTTNAIALAQNLSGLEKKVLLIEGDIRRRTFSAYFPDASGMDGILSVISGKVPLERAVHRPDGLGFDVLMGEKSSINAADVFSSDRFHKLIETLRETYDYVLIDTPPVLVVPDARVIAQSVDAVIYSVNWDRTTKSQVEEGLKQFSSVNIPVTGLVLSQIDPKGMKRYGYGGKYGAYSRYAQGYYEA